MKIWTITYNDDNGITTQVHNSEASVASAALTWCHDVWDFDDPLPDDWREAVGRIYDAGSIDSLHVDEHTVFPPEHTLVEEIIADWTPDRSDGDLEVDDNAPISWIRDGVGAYVQCWKWLPFDWVEQPMIIEENGTIWYFEDFDEFMLAWGGAPDSCGCRMAEPGDLEASAGANDSWEFLTAKNDELKLMDYGTEQLQEMRRGA